MRDLGYGTRRGLPTQAADAKKKLLAEFFATHGRFPSQHRSEERNLQARLRDYCNPKCSTYDAEFHAWCKERGYGKGGTGIRVYGETK